MPAHRQGGKMGEEGHELWERSQWSRWGWSELPALTSPAAAGILTL